MILRDSLKQEIDTLSDHHLSAVADLIASFKQPPQALSTEAPLWQTSTFSERATELQTWVSNLVRTSQSLPDDAFDRGNIYE